MADELRRAHGAGGPGQSAEADARGRDRNRGGGSLSCIAPHCEQVHSFDLVEPAAGVADQPNLTVHTGDSHELLPAALADFATEDRQVDFALVDGDHTAAGVRRDIEGLLDSPAVRDAVILAHDAANGVVREGLESVDYDARAQVSYVDLDFIGGYVFRKGQFEGEVWGGLGLIVVGSGRATAYVEGRAPGQDARHPTFELLSLGWAEHARRDRLLAKLGGLASPDQRTVTALEGRLALEHAEVERLRALLGSVQGSASWRITEPLRRLAGRLRSGADD